jgi:DMSO/TMAO reductase YedYZ heme-binding membrane subunit
VDPPGDATRSAINKTSLGANPMSFREKSAWISFICLLLLTLAFVLGQHFAARHDVPLHMALAIFLGFLLLQVVLHLIVVAQAPRDARTPKDERERLIELRAARIGFYALVVCELIAMGLFHAHGSAGTLMFSGLLAIFVAWLIKLGNEIVLYRRG